MFQQGQRLQRERGKRRKAPADADPPKQQEGGGEVRPALGAGGGHADEDGTAQVDEQRVQGERPPLQGRDEAHGVAAHGPDGPACTDGQKVGKHSSCSSRSE